MFAEERHQKILEVLQRDGRITIAEIQKMFNVSEDSARRDLRILEKKNLINRTRGGALLLRQAGFNFPRRRDLKNLEHLEDYDQYILLAKAGASLVKENDIVFLTNNNVGFVMLRYLPRDIKYTLVINSATLANELKYWDNVVVYQAGGEMRMNSATSFVDTYATEFIKNMHFDLSLIEVAGGDAAFGASCRTSETAAFYREVIKNSKKSVLLLPARSVGYAAFIRICPMDAFDLLITSERASNKALRDIGESGLKIVIAKGEKDCSG